MREWQPIETAPKDGTKLDLWFKGVRARTIACFWYEGSIKPEGGWFWRTPLWQDSELLPESRWTLNCYPSAEPTHWRAPPDPPATK